MPIKTNKRTSISHEDPAERRKLLEAEHRRRALTQAKRGINLENLLDMLHKIAVEEFPKAHVDHSRDRLTVRCERAWAVSCDFHMSFATRDRESVTDGDGTIYTPCDVVTSIGWSSCGRDIPHALAAADLYRTMIGLAAHLEAKAESMSPYLVEKP
jgi:hypothetical protein